MENVRPIGHGEVTLSSLTRSIYTVVFAPLEEESQFVLRFKVPKPTFMEKLRRQCQMRLPGGGTDLDGDKFYAKLAEHCVLDWRGLTPKEVERCGIAEFNEPEEAYTAFGGAEAEIRFSKTQLFAFMAESRPFKDRIDNLSQNLSDVQAAAEVARRRGLGHAFDGAGSGPE